MTAEKVEHHLEGNSQLLALAYHRAQNANSTGGALDPDRYAPFVRPPKNHDETRQIEERNHDVQRELGLCRHREREPCVDPPLARSPGEHDEGAHLDEAARYEREWQGFIENCRLRNARHRQQ